MERVAVDGHELRHDRCGSVPDRIKSTSEARSKR